MKPVLINTGGKLLDLSEPRIMGVLNVTPDSFYAGSRLLTEADIISRAAKAIGEGASVIDIGGYSSRPGAADISEKEESERVLPAIRTVLKNFPGTVVSVDTFRASVAERAIDECGAGMINDIFGGEGDKDMFSIAAKYKVPYVLMHMQGTPASMQNSPVYDDVVADILMWFAPRIRKLVELGVNDIIIDPGFGFGKTIEQNFEMLSRLGEFRIAELPVLAGLSRKSMIWKTLATDPAGALNGTTVLNTVALMGGADILRVHDVKEAAEAIKLYSATVRNREGKGI